MALLIQISSDLPNVKSNLICTVSGHFEAAAAAISAIKLAQTPKY